MRRIALLFAVLVVAVQAPALAKKLAKQTPSEQNSAIFVQLIKPVLQKSLVEELLGEVEVASLAYAPAGWEDQCVQIRPALNELMQGQLRPWAQKMVDGKALEAGINSALQEQLTAAERLLVITAMDGGNLVLATYLVVNHKGLAERMAGLVDAQMEVAKPGYLQIMDTPASAEFKQVVETCRTHLASSEVEL
ncbi:MAG: hypothetical protein ACN6OR_01730 [Stenotrophomonas sp.]|uniref:hypothetical protein n=1 Tax=Stenotrophomonas sp. TaxID=69392 RepID=UPI0028AA9019|nr:hypothetical protein [Stenotrophomonas sp.]